MRPMGVETTDRSRLDQALVNRGLAPTRSQARDLVKRGCVSVSGRPAAKPSQNVGPGDTIEVAAGAQPYVSRGGLKLAAALDAFGLDPAGLIALDIGASTGGFTHVLLERGARRVFAVDVGHGQLHPSIVADPRVTSFEGLDARILDLRIIGEPPDAIVADVSFVSLTKALETAVDLAAPGAWLVALIKPQFEVGREAIGKGGVVRDETARTEAAEKVHAWLANQPGWRVLGIIPSPVAGGSGNIEMLIGARRDG